MSPTGPRRRSSATQQPEAGYELRTIHELSDQQDVPMMMICNSGPFNHKGGQGVKNPVDRL